MKELTIGEIAESFQNGIGKGKSYYGRGTKVANISDLYENPVFKPIKYSLLQVTDKEKKKYLLQKGDLLFVRSSLKREGVAFCSMYDSKEECLFSSFMIRVRLRKELSDPKYVSYILRSNVCRERLIGASNTSTITNINQEGLSSVQIPLPSLPIQQKIAAILDAADEYRQKTKALVAKYDQLAQSLFLDMFGDPVSNPKGWEKVIFQKMVASDCPLTYGIVQPGDEVESGVPCVRPVDLVTQYVEVETLKKIDAKISDQFKRTILKSGEILLSVRGSVGVISIAGESLKGSNVTRGIVPIWFDAEISNKLFFFYLYKTVSIQNQIKGLARGATLIQLNLADLRNLELIKPPLKLQTQFAERIQQIELLKQQAQASLQKAEELFQSLLQRAFKGELV
ncbi:restriction endonuclease subunit S [Mangrovibacterium marinum]|uniref:restriction endonuclease subunit S n=1 Tax=Mangrovibacterium marinum TaxID=1639118 RepID=UPI002A18CB8E|nr:restriction endonuclease subunit S [Mangrovibacterium marinum]